MPLTRHTNKQEMIAGENETFYRQSIGLESPFDNFLGIGKGKNKVKGEGKGKFWKSIGTFYKNAGGIEGLDRSVGNVAGLFKTQEPEQIEESDYQFSMQGHRDNPGENKQQIPMGVYIIGGFAVLVIAGLMFKTIKAQPTETTNLQH